VWGIHLYPSLSIAFSNCRIWESADSIRRQLEGEERLLVLVRRSKSTGYLAVFYYASIWALVDIGVMNKLIIIRHKIWPIYAMPFSTSDFTCDESSIHKCATFEDSNSWIPKQWLKLELDDMVGKYWRPRCGVGWYLADVDPSSYITHPSSLPCYSVNDFTHFLTISSQFTHSQHSGHDSRSSPSDSLLTPSQENSSILLLYASSSNGIQAKFQKMRLLRGPIQMSSTSIWNHLMKEKHQRV